MEEIRKIGFGSVNDKDKSLQSKATGMVKFGLNRGFITKLEYNPNAGAGGGAGDAVDIHVKIGEREFRRRIFDVTRVYDSKGNLILDENSEEYIKKYNSELNQVMGVIIHAVKATGVTQQQVDVALQTPLNNFADWSKVVTALVPVGFETRPVDVFLEYQWIIKENNDRTYLELPKNMKGGYFLNPTLSSVGEWKEEKNWTRTNDKGLVEKMQGLRYVDDSNNVHPFTRTSNYMESKKANQQLDTPTAPIVSESSASTW